MKVLLDTHVFIWWDSAPHRLSPRAQAVCADAQNELLLSVASVWEIQIKQMLGKLTLQRPLRDVIFDQVQRNALRLLNVELNPVLRLGALPAKHKDPFDRLLVAQALTENCPLLSHDASLSQYPVTVLW